jgi:general secretion pathway protein I
MATRKSFSAGFTLLEVLVSLAVVSIALMAILKLQSQSLDLGGETRFLSTAPLLATAKVADIDALYPDLPFQLSGDFGDRHPDYRWEAALEPVQSEALGEVSENLQQVDVTVSHTATGRTYRLRTYRLYR